MRGGRDWDKGGLCGRGDIDGERLRRLRKCATRNESRDKQCRTGEHSFPM
jgi:hypothetical protein